MRRPNLIVFFSDQQRWDTCGCYGQRWPVTPNLDRMAAEGVRFAHSFTCQPVCGPARACLQTGRYATETGCFTNAIALRPDEDTIAKRLRASGYEAAYIGKWHLASTPEKRMSAVEGRVVTNYGRAPVPPEYRGGYDDFWIASDVLEFTSHAYDGHMFDAGGEKVEMEGYRVDWMTNLAIDYLRGRDSDAPFLLFLSYLEPHQQNDHDRFEGPLGSDARWKHYDVPGDLQGTEGDWRESYPDYLGCCAALDNGLGRIRAELARLGLADETLLLYTSDHGCHFRTRNHEYKRSCHDAALRTPLVLCGPGFEGGRTVEEMVSLVDLPPTLLEAAGLEVPGFMRGRPLQPLADGTAEDWPREIFAQISEHELGRTVRTRRYKYGVNVPGDEGWERPASDRYVEAYLYDLDTDPHERDNRVAEPGPADVRADLRERLRAYVREVEGVDVEIEPARPA